MLLVSAICTAQASNETINILPIHVHSLQRKNRMRSDRRYYVYLMTNRSKTLYTGMTNNLRKRVWEHKTGVNEGFTKKYKLDRLVYWESFGQPLQAITRETESKGWLRIKKIELIVSVNPTWADLSRTLFPDLEEGVQREIANLEKGRRS